MKLRKEISELREKFVRDLFSGETRLSIPAANKILKDHFGSKMRLNRLYQLRREIREGIPQ